MYTYPFQIKFLEDRTSDKFDLNFERTKNILNLININNLSKEDYSNSLFKDFLSKFAFIISQNSSCIDNFFTSLH